jgi:hypothetical protein
MGTTGESVHCRNNLSSSGPQNVDPIENKIVPVFSFNFEVGADLTTERKIAKEM